MEVCLGRVYLVVLLALAAVGVSVFAGCSGDGGEAGSRGQPPSDYYEAIVDIGVRGSELGKLLVLMEPGDSNGATYVKEMEQLPKRAEELKPPKEFKADHEAFVEGLRRLADDGGQVEQASQAGDEAELGSARTAMNETLLSILDVMMAIRGGDDRSPAAGAGSPAADSASPTPAP